jgi:hypothetical protein
LGYFDFLVLCYISFFDLSLEYCNRSNDISQD